MARRVGGRVAAEAVGRVVGLDQVLDARGGLDDDAAGRRDNLGAFAERVGVEKRFGGAAEARAGRLAFV